MVARISRGRDWGLSKIERSGTPRLEKLPMPSRRRMLRSAGYVEASPPIADDA
jgi:hypothetical protein